MDVSNVQSRSHEKELLVLPLQTEGRKDSCAPCDVKTKNTLNWTRLYNRADWISLYLFPVRVSSEGCDSAPWSLSEMWVPALRKAALCQCPCERSSAIRSSRKDIFKRFNVRLKRHCSLFFRSMARLTPVYFWAAFHGSGSAYWFRIMDTQNVPPLCGSRVCVCVWGETLFLFQHDNSLGQVHK